MRNPRLTLWIATGILVGLGLNFASLAVSFSTSPNLLRGSDGVPTPGSDPFERMIVRGFPFPWVEDRPTGAHGEFTSVVRSTELMASLIFWAGLGGVVARVAYRRWTLAQQGARARACADARARLGVRARAGDIPYAESSVVARGVLSFAATCVGWAVVIAWTGGSLTTWFGPLWIPIAFFWWPLGFLPLVAFVDERSKVFSIRRLPFIVAGLAVGGSAIFVVPIVLLGPWPAIVGLIAGAFYALALRQLKRWTAYTIEATHVPWK